MKIYTPIGSKKRLFEMFQKVNKIKLNEEEYPMDINSILEQSFESLKRGELSIQKGGSSNTTVQMGDNESTIEIIGVDNNKNNLNFAFKLEFEEGDQEGVSTVTNVTLLQFIFKNADGTKSYELKGDDLSNFNQEHNNELLDVIQDFSDADLTKTEEPVTDELYEEAIKTIDTYPIDMEYYTQRKITQFPDGKLQTGKAYADEKPTNPAVRVTNAPELDKFVQEEINSVAGNVNPVSNKIRTNDELKAYREQLKAQGFKGLRKVDVPLLADQILYDMAVKIADRMLPMGWDGLSDVNSMWDYINKNGGMSFEQLLKAVKKAVNVRLKEEGQNLKSLGLGENEDDDTDLSMSPTGYNANNTLEPEVDDEPVPELSDENKEILYKAYDALVQRDGNYAPTRDEVMAEISKMTGKKGEIGVEKKRAISPAEEPFTEGQFLNKSISNAKEAIIDQAIINVKTKLVRLNKHVEIVELTSLVKEEVAKILEEQRLSVSNESEVINEDELTYPDPLGKEFKPEVRYPKKRKKHSKKITLKTTNESTDQDKYEDVVFLQGDEAFEPLELIKTKGKDAALEYLKQWHMHPGSSMGRQESGHGGADSTYEKDGYIMFWNSHLDYIGLEYDLSQMNEEEYGDEDISGLSNVPTDYDAQKQATKDMSPEINKKGNDYSSNPDKWNKHPLPYDTEFNLNEKNDEINVAEPEEIETNEPESDNSTSNEPETDKIEQLAQDKEETGEMLVGGDGDGKSPLEFDSDQVLKGMEVEIEHADNPMISLEIVLDHLTEDPEYYTVKDNPEDSAQQSAAMDANGEEDKEKSDILLGFKPHNVGDKIEGDKEPEEKKIEDKKEDKLGESNQGMSYEEFSKQYSDTFKQANKYSPNEVGSQTYTEKMAKLADEYPEFLERLEQEQDKQAFGESKESELKQNDPATWHQIQIAKKTIKMPDAMAAVMGGMTKEEAKRILTQRGLKFNENNDFTNNPLGAEKHYNDTNAYQKYQQYQQMDFNNLTDDQKEELFKLWIQFKENR